MTPAVNFAKEWTVFEFGQGQPILDRLYGAQPGQSRAGKLSPFQLAISFAPREIAGQAFAGNDLDVFNAQTGELVSSEAPPEADEDQCPIAGMSQ